MMKTRIYTAKINRSTMKNEEDWWIGIYTNENCRDGLYRSSILEHAVVSNCPETVALILCERPTLPGRSGMLGPLQRAQDRIEKLTDAGPEDVPAAPAAP